MFRSYDAAEEEDDDYIVNDELSASSGPKITRISEENFKDSVSDTPTNYEVPKRGTIPSPTGRGKSTTRPFPRLSTASDIKPLSEYLKPIVDRIVDGDLTMINKLRPLANKDTTKLIEDCLSVLAAFIAKVVGGQCRARVAKRCMALFSDDVDDGRHKFAMRVITSNVLQQGRMYAVHVLEYYSPRLSPYIILESLLSPALYSSVASVGSTVLPYFAKADLLGVIDFVATNYRNPTVIVEKLRSCECFQPFPEIDIDAMVASWTPIRLRKVVINICKSAKILPLPLEAQPLLIAVAMEANANAFNNSLMELEDVVPICRNLVGSVKENWRLIYDIVSEHSKTMASYLSLHAGLGLKVHLDEPFVPSCASPFNERLHSLPHCQGIIVDSSKVAKQFEKCLLDSCQYAVDFFSTFTLVKRIGGGVITFVFRTGIFYVLPRLYSDAFEAVGRALRDDQGHCAVFNLKWTQDRIMFVDAFGFEPKQVIDAQKVATDELKTSMSFENMVLRVTGGSFCRRASFFADFALPSVVALEHRALRACVVYDFIVDARNLTETRERINEQTDGRCSDESNLPEQPHSLLGLAEGRRGESPTFWEKREQAKELVNGQHREKRKNFKEPKDECRSDAHNHSSGSRKTGRDTPVDCMNEGKRARFS